MRSSSTSSHYAPNSKSAPDFEEVGTELKTTPLKRRKNGGYSAKERLVISMINYMKVVDETWESSSLLKKLHKILLIAYQYDKDLNPVDYLVKLVELWHIPPEDVPTFKKDWDTVVGKIRAGHAHELSGSDTLYLEAATKASSSKARTPQPYSTIPAKHERALRQIIVHDSDVQSFTRCAANTAQAWRGAT